MNNKKKIIVILAVIIVVAIIIAIYKTTSSYLFSNDGKINDNSHNELIEHINSIEDEEEKNKQINYSLEQNLITEQEADELNK